MLRNGRRLYTTFLPLPYPVNNSSKNATAFGYRQPECPHPPKDDTTCALRSAILDGAAIDVQAPRCRSCAAIHKDPATLRTTHCVHTPPLPTHECPRRTNVQKGVAPGGQLCEDCVTEYGKSLKYTTTGHFTTGMAVGAILVVECYMLYNS